MSSTSKTKKLTPAFFADIERHRGKLEHKSSECLSHCVSYNHETDEQIYLVVSYNSNGDLEITLEPDNSAPSSMVVTPNTNYTEINSFVFNLIEQANHKHTSQAHMLCQAVVCACHFT